MFRTTVLVAGMLLFLNVAAIACGGADCSQAIKAKPLDIRQFMREQAASTRGVTLRPVTSLAARTHATSRRLADLYRKQISRPASSPTRAADRRSRTIHATANRYVSHGRSVAARSKPTTLPVEPTSFASQKPFVQVVPSDELNAIDQGASAFAAARVATGENVRQVVAEAFDDIDLKQEGSLTIDDLYAASERAKVAQNGFSWLQRMWSTLAGALPAFGSD